MKETVGPVPTGEGTTLRVMVADGPYGEFYDFDSDSAEYFDCHLVFLRKVEVNYTLLLLLLLLLLFSLWAGLAGTRAQSGDRYGSGTLRSRQVHRGRLPLLFPAFRRSHLRFQMHPRPHQRERS
jgi:hypothetical protein